jgi:hypothetical protein
VSLQPKLEWSSSEHGVTFTPKGFMKDLTMGWVGPAVQGGPSQYYIAYANEAGPGGEKVPYTACVSSTGANHPDSEDPVIENQGGGIPPYYPDHD